MNAHLLNRPAPRWPLAAAFAGAILLHLGAIALAGRQPIDPPPAPIDDGGVDLTFVPVERPPDPSPPIEEIPAPEIPPTPDPFTIDETPPPPPKKSTVPPRERLVSPSAAGAKVSGKAVRALSAPRPEYPYEARRQRLTGSGVAALTIDRASGTVVDVIMVRSTGSTVLDNATISALRRWRFPAGAATKVQTPITYTLKGASF